MRLLQCCKYAAYAVILQIRHAFKKIYSKILTNLFGRNFSVHSIFLEISLHEKSF